MPWQQIGVGGDAVAGIGLVPLAFEAFQTIAVAVLLGRRQVQRREFDGERLARRHVERMVGSVQAGQRFVLADMDITDNDRWRIGPRLQLVGMEDEDAGRSAHQDFMGARQRARADPVVEDRQAAFAAEAVQVEGVRIDDGQAGICAGPYPSLVIEQQLVDILVRQAVVAAYMMKAGTAGRVAPGQHVDTAAGRADPQTPATVKYQRGDIAAAQPLRIGLVGRDAFDRPSAAGHQAGGQAVEAVFAAGPDGAVRRLGDGTDLRVGQAGKVVGLLCFLAGCETPQAVIAAQPHLAAVGKQGDAIGTRIAALDVHARDAVAAQRALVQALGGGDINHPVTRRQGPDIGLRQGGFRMGRVRGQRADTPLGWIQDIDTFTRQARPDVAVGHFSD